MTDDPRQNRGAADRPPERPDGDAAPWDAFEELSELGESELAAIRDELEAFRDRVYWLVRQIPEGRVATYGQIATYAGSPRAARAVGNLMKGSVNRGIPLPWHRVINAKGGISSRGDVDRARRQRERLEAEGVSFERGTCRLADYRWEPEASFWDGLDQRGG